MTNNEDKLPLEKPQGTEASVEVEPTEQPSSVEKLWSRVLHLGLGETTLKVGTAVVSVVLVLIAVWVMSKFVLKNQEKKHPD